jgi:hypothetical protein
LIVAGLGSAGFAVDTPSVAPGSPTAAGIAVVVEAAVGFCGAAVETGCAATAVTGAPTSFFGEDLPHDGSRLETGTIAANIQRRVRCLLVMVGSVWPSLR